MRGMPASSWPISARNARAPPRRRSRRAPPRSARRPARRRCRRRRPQRRDGLGVAVLGGVGDVQDGLQVSRSMPSGTAVGERAGRRAAVEVRGEPLQQRDLVLRILEPDAGGLGLPLQAPLDDLVVGEHQLDVDRLGVAHGVDAAVDVEDVLVGERADDVQERRRPPAGARGTRRRARRPCRCRGRGRRRRRTARSRGSSRARSTRPPACRAARPGRRRRRRWPTRTSRRTR